jgi:hypothetical protein
VAAVLRDQLETVDEGSCGYQDIGVADQLAAAVQFAVKDRRPDDDLVGQREEKTPLALHLEASHLLGGAARAETTEDFVPAEDREGELAVLSEVHGGGRLNGGILSLHDVREHTGVQEGWRRSGHRGAGMKRERSPAMLSIAATSSGDRSA